jgi:hypothetical protein
MPESVTDRPTKAHEYIFLLTKGERYFYDAEAIKEQSSQNTHNRLPGNVNPSKCQKAYEAGDHLQRTKAGLLNYARKLAVANSGIKNNESFDAAMAVMPSTRNKRSVWTVTTNPYKDAHFATFPPDLIKPCILAGTSAYGCCAACGAPWERTIEKGAPLEEWKRACGADKNGEYHGKNQKNYQQHLAQPASTVKERILKGMVERKTVGWNPTCECNAAVVPCTVLDPFGGSGTTGEVSMALGRNAILIELNPDYITLINQRTNITPGLQL